MGLKSTGTFTLVAMALPLRMAGSKRHWRTAFTAARTVRTGKATFKLTLTGTEGGV